MNFNLQADARSLMAIIGPSGAGKSTLLSLIAGFEKPLSGHVTIKGREVLDLPPSERPVSMIFQTGNVFSHLSVEDNVALGIRPDLRLNDEDRLRLKSAIGRVGLAGLEKRLPGEVSGGEMQRIAIARAYLRDRPVLLLDEPFAALGPALRRDMLELIQDLKNERDVAVLMVTHQPEDAEDADAIAFLDKGRIESVMSNRVFRHGPHSPALQQYLGQ